MVRASLACFNAAAQTFAGIPSSLVSSCKAVMKSDVPATLKSISPNASSDTRMSVKATYSCLPSTSPEINPIAIPPTIAFSGTPALSIAMVEAQTEAIEVDPFDEIASETCLIA